MLKYYTDIGFRILLSKNPWEATSGCRLPLDRLIEDIAKACATKPKSLPDREDKLLDKIRRLLRAMEKLQGDRPFLVPFQSVFKLSQEILFYLSPTYYDGDVPHKGIRFLSKILQLLLSSGVDLTNATIDTDHCSLSYTLLFCDVVKCLPRKDIDSLFPYLMKLHTLLLSYGYQPDTWWFDGLLNVLKLKPAADAEKDNTSTSDFDTFVMRSVNMMNKDTRRKFQAHIKQATNPPNINFCLSLEQECRGVLYQNVPKRRMVAYVDQLPLPKSLKTFLIFESD